MLQSALENTKGPGCYEPGPLRRADGRISAD